jgi:hypothetical protein
MVPTAMTTRARLVGAGLTLGALMLGVAPTVGAQTPIPVDVLAKLFFKICTYDENLPADLMRIGIAYPATDAANGAAVTAVFRTLEKMKVNGRPIEVSAIAYGAPADIGTAVKDRGLYGIFVTASASATDITAIREIAKKRRLFTFAQDDRQVAVGLTAGVATEDDRRVILLNMTVALEQGRKYNGNFIKACKVIR